MKNKLSKMKGLAIGAAATAMSAGVTLAEGLDTAAATAGIADAITKGTAVIVAGFGIGVVFMVARVIRRGMRTAG